MITFFQIVFLIIFGGAILPSCQFNVIHASPSALKELSVQADSGVKVSVAAHLLEEASQRMQACFGLNRLTLGGLPNELASVLNNSETDQQLAIPLALEIALRTILQSDSDAESPLALVQSLSERSRSVKGSQFEAEFPSANLLDYLDDKETRLQLLVLPHPELGLYLPENGESPEDNWIFVLRMPALSDHIFWVVVDKAGIKAPYVYGFN